MCMYVMMQDKKVENVSESSIKNVLHGGGGVVRNEMTKNTQQRLRYRRIFSHYHCLVFAEGVGFREK